MRTTQFGSRPGTSSSTNLGSPGYGSGSSGLYARAGGTPNTNTGLARPGSSSTNLNSNNSGVGNNISRLGGGSNTIDSAGTGGRAIAPAFGSLAVGGVRPGSGGGNINGTTQPRAASAGIGQRLPPAFSTNTGGVNRTNSGSGLGSTTASNYGSQINSPTFRTNNNNNTSGTTTNSAVGSGLNNNNSLLRSLRPGSSGAQNMPQVPHDPNHPAANGAFGNNLSNTTSPATNNARVGVGRFGNTIGSPASLGGRDQQPVQAPAFSCTVLSSQSRSSTKPLSLYVGSGCTQGFRPTMEDEHINMIGAKTIDGNPLSLFAILDGHCGRRVAELGSQMLPEALFNHPQLGQNNAQAFVESIMQVDKQVHATIRNQDGGATLIAALVHKRMLFVACLGDARAVLCDSGVAIPMSIDHKPSDPQEQARIVRCGGFVHFGRVSGCLAVSRALGDFEFKVAMGRFVQKEFQVSNIADIRQINLTDGSKFLIIACDGLWDVMTNDEAVNWVNDYLAKQEAALIRNPTDVLNRASQAMAEAAVSKGSTDNVSVTILMFHTPGAKE